MHSYLYKENNKTFLQTKINLTLRHGFGQISTDLKHKNILLNNDYLILKKIIFKYLRLSKCLLFQILLFHMNYIFFPLLLKEIILFLRYLFLVSILLFECFLNLIMLLPLLILNITVMLMIV